MIVYLLFVATTSLDFVLPSEYGYDSASACARELRQQRARELPCDFNKQSWCAVAGKSYPWQAVRRFVQENHGLMKRMYGDERHLSVIQQELENEIDVDFQKIPFTNKYRNLQHDNTHDPKVFYSDVIDANVYIADDENEADDYTNPRYLRQNDVLMNTKFTFADAEFRPNDLFFRQNLPSTTTKESLKLSDTLDSKPTVPDPVIQEVLSNDLEGNGVYNVKNFTVVILEENNNTNSSNNQNFTIIEESLDRNMSKENASLFEDVTTDSLTTSEEIFTTITEEIEENTTTTKANIEDTLSHDYHENTSSNNDMDSQLFQDLDQDTSDSVVEPIKIKGVNACPVKEEVVAPFWANNTRGEILALLNLYPFEQYVHWEKCTFEHKQMYCREGCRCEQQYRLHRLLAYDPNNECRGIFSDWFRFPSCCVCKCYNLPTELRVTSRSPRNDPVNYRRAKIDPIWYRPSTSHTDNQDSFV